MTQKSQLMRAHSRRNQQKADKYRSVLRYFRSLFEGLTDFGVLDGIVSQCTALE